jgi:hypothetical protein
MWSDPSALTAHCIHMNIYPRMTSVTVAVLGRQAAGHERALDVVADYDP